MKVRRVVAGAFVVVGLVLVAMPAIGGADMLAPRSHCSGQSNVKAGERQQEDAMRCLVNYARERAGAGQVRSNKSLEKAAGHKAADVKRCGLSHTACGRPPDAYARRFGYVGGSYQWGETLAAEGGKGGSARKVMKAWLGSTGHRETILRPAFDDIGIGLKRGVFGGRKNVAVWTLNLGCHGC